MGFSYVRPNAPTLQRALLANRTRRPPAGSSSRPHSSGSEVAIVVNGHTIRTLPGDHTADVYGDRNWHADSLPRDVVVTRTSDGQTLLTVHLTEDGSDGQRVRIGPAPPLRANLVGYTCGSV